MVTYACKRYRKQMLLGKKQYFPIIDMSNKGFYLIWPTKTATGALKKGSIRADRMNCTEGKREIRKAAKNDLVGSASPA